MNKTTKTLIALVAGAALALSVSVPASATTLTTGAKSCPSSYDKQKSFAKYTVEHHIYSPAQFGEYWWTYNNSSTYVSNYTSWNGASGRITIKDASNSWVNGLYLSSASIYCA